MGTTSSSNSAATYTFLSSTTLNSPATNVTFSSIPQIYTDLIVITNGKMNVAGTQNIYYRFNPGSGGTYSDWFFYANGSSVLSGSHTNGTYGLVGDFSDTQSLHIGQIMGYSNTNMMKTVLARYGNVSDAIIVVNLLWQSNTAISTLEVSLGGSTNFASGTVVSLYGIQAA